MELSQGRVVANGVDFAYLEVGSGPLALCLHGFPDSAHTYRHLLPVLAGAGYRAVAVFMRGYAPTAVPANGSFRTADLVADAVALHAALGGDANAVLVAHDWGAVGAWGSSAHQPALWRKVVVVNVPPLALYGQIASHYDQIKRSFYFWFFQMPVAEAVVAADDLAFLDGLWGDWSPGYDAGFDLARVKDALREPVNLHAALGYYRATFDPARYGSDDWAAEQGAAWGAPPSTPVLYLHGTTDGCIALPADLVPQVRSFLGSGSEVELLKGVGHFLLVERPTAVNERIVSFLGS